MRIEKKALTGATKDEKLMGFAWWASALSKDPNFPVGCCVVEDSYTSHDGEPLIWACNGFPKQITETSDWDKDYLIQHAICKALNLCHNAQALKNSLIYVTTLPCRNCILQAIDRGVKKIIYFPSVVDEAYSIDHETNLKVAQELATIGRTPVEVFSGNLNWMRDKINEFNALGIF